MVGKALECLYHFRVVERNEGPGIIEEEGCPVLLIQCDDNDFLHFDLIDVEGVRSVEPL